MWLSRRRSNEGRWMNKKSKNINSLYKNRREILIYRLCLIYSTDVGYSYWFAVRSHFLKFHAFCLRTASLLFICVLLSVCLPCCQCTVLQSEPNWNVSCWKWIAECSELRIRLFQFGVLAVPQHILLLRCLNMCMYEFVRSESKPKNKSRIYCIFRFYNSNSRYPVE